MKKIDNKFGLINIFPHFNYSSNLDHVLFEDESYTSSPKNPSQCMSVILCIYITDFNCRHIGSLNKHQNFNELVSVAIGQKCLEFIKNSYITYFSPHLF